MTLFSVFLLLGFLIGTNFALPNENGKFISNMSLEEFRYLIDKENDFINFDGLPFEEAQRRVISAIIRNDQLSSIAESEMKEFGFFGRSEFSTLSANFPCQPFSSNSTPTSVHRLTPADIKVVAAVGDSLTAGTGIKACTLIGVLFQYRGSSYSIGGDGIFASNPTLPNILRLYNKDIVGYSIKTGKVTSKNANLNRAIPGEESPDLVKQVEDLIQKMKADSSVNFNDDWKLITILMGNNDICDSCKRENASAAAFKQRMEAALDLLHQNVPRALVNLVSLFDVPQVPKLNIGLVCSALHLYACKCAAFPKNSSAVVELTTQYQDALFSIAADGRYDTRDDFTVVVQPFLRDTIIPVNSKGKVDLSYFSPDCFHLSTLGHVEAAKALWNNMLEKVGSKETSWYVGEGYHCPDMKFPYFYTNKNSN